MIRCYTYFNLNGGCYENADFHLRLHSASRFSLTNGGLIQWSHSFCPRWSLWRSSSLTRFPPSARWCGNASSHRQEPRRSRQAHDGSVMPYYKIEIAIKVYAADHREAEAISRDISDDISDSDRSLLGVKVNDITTIIPTDTLDKINKALATAPYVGQPCTVGIGSDCYAYEVISIDSPKRITIGRYGNTERWSLRKDNRWRPTGCGRNSGHYLTLGVAENYLDLSF